MTNLSVNSSESAEYNFTFSHNGTAIIATITNVTSKSNPISSYAPILIIVVFVLTVCLNGLVLLMFTKHSDLRTPFGVYLISLLSCNICYAVSSQPLSVVNFLYTRWPLSSRACTFLLYANSLILAIAKNLHVLITVNRIWAMRYPHSYRHNHTNKVASLLCVLVVVYVHLLVLPGVIRDDLYYRVPLSKGKCLYNFPAQYGYAAVVLIITFIMPNVLIVVTYPLIALLRWRQRKKSIRISHASQGTKSKTKTEMSQSVATNGTTKNATSSKRAFVILTLTTLSVATFWLPADLFYAISVFKDLSAYVITRTALQNLIPIQYIMDPVIFVVSLPSLRKHILAICGRLA